MKDLNTNKKEALIGRIPLICFIFSLIYIVDHCYRVSIDMTRNRYIYSIASFLVHLLVPAIIAILYYLLRKRRISFLKVYFVITFIIATIDYISTFFS